jgi:hypothetical protein
MYMTKQPRNYEFMVVIRILGYLSSIWSFYGFKTSITFMLVRALASICQPWARVVLYLNFVNQTNFELLPLPKKKNFSDKFTEQFLMVSRDISHSVILFVKKCQI